MWFIGEIETEMKLGRCREVLTRGQILTKCKVNSVHPRPYWANTRKFLGYAITDEEYDLLFGIPQK